MSRNKFQQGLALFLTASLLLTMVPGAAFGQDPGLEPPAYDESYYATLDYYGGVTESSVVKSYRLNGAGGSIVDYGSYDDIINMTDFTSPAIGGDNVTFTFADQAPDRFYFEGKTTAPFELLPWKLDVSYKLNGVPAKAEELAGEKGLVEIIIDAMPNPDAPEYYRNNLVLQAATVLDNDKVLSVEAPGAQVQTLGNIKAVLFMAFPGEEQHFTLRIGSDDFSFAGMTFLMVPATLSQLDQVADLREAKEKMEDSADAISDSVDIILNTLDGLSGDLSKTADGLAALNEARATVSAGKEQVYSSADGALADLSVIADSLEFLPYHLGQAQSFLTDSTDRLDNMVKTAVGLKKQLKETRTVIHNLQQDTKDLRDMVNDVEWRSWNAAHSSGSLSKDFDALGSNMDGLKDSLSQLQSILGGLAGADIGGPIADLVNGTTLEGKSLEEVQEIVAMVAEAKALLEQALGQEPTAEQLVAAIAQTLIEKGMPEGAALQQAASAVALYETMTGLSGSSSDIMNQVNALLATLGGSGLSGDLESLTSCLAGTMYTMNNHNGEIAGALYDLDDLGDVLEDVTKVLDKSLEQLDDLNKTLDGYIPDAQLALEDAKRLAAAAVSGINNTQDFLNSLEGLMKESGTQLDAGTQATLEGLEGSLNQAVRGLRQTGTLRNAKNTVKDLIDDEWDEHTGGTNNLLLMDPEATPVSLTSAENPAPQSLQILLRTESIKADDNSDTIEVDESFHAEGNFFSRVANIFKTIWHTITSWFSA